MDRIAPLLALALTLAACGPQASAAKPATVEVKGFEYAPKVLEITRGTTVTWINRDAVLHTATAGSAMRKDDLGNYERQPTGAFDARMADAAARASATFDRAGEFTYFCDRHPHMTGRVVVR